MKNIYMLLVLVVVSCAQLKAPESLEGDNPSAKTYVGNLGKQSQSSYNSRNS